MGKTPRFLTSWFVAIVTLCSFAGSASAATDDVARADGAMAYVGAHQLANGSFPGFSAIGSTADAVLDMAATGYDRVPDAIGFLRRQVRKGNVIGAGLTAKVVMAAEAAGDDPTVFGGIDLIGRITDAEKPSGRFAGASVFDQALAILALRDAGVAPTDAELTWLADAQCPDGGWQFDRPHRATENKHCRDVNDPSDSVFSDTNTTAYALMALHGLKATDVDPLAFFAAIRDDIYHGWGYTWGFRRTDANSTALVIQAYAASGKALPHGGMRALRSLQYRCGAVAYSFTKDGRRTGKDVGASIGAVLGFLQEPLPDITPVSLGPPWATTCPPD
jgi:hypothetical protein